MVTLSDQKKRKEREREREREEKKMAAEDNNRSRTDLWDVPEPCVIRMLYRL